jgi:hypothetical protein
MNKNIGAKMQTYANAKDKCAWLKGSKGISEYTGVCTRTATAWLADGLPAKRLTARLLLVRPEDVDKFIEERATEHASRIGVEA